NLTGGLAMLVGRFLMIVPLLAMAGSLARKRIVPATAGTLATGSATFAVLLAAVILIVGALEYFPALALGPIVEHFQMLAGSLHEAPGDREGDRSRAPQPRRVIPAAAPLHETTGYRKPKYAPRRLFDPPIVHRALVEAARKLDPRHMARNPVMF